MSAPVPTPQTATGTKGVNAEDRALTRAKNAVNYLIDPKAGPQPARLRTRATLRGFRYLAIFIFWRVVRYAKYAAVGALVAAVSGGVIGSAVSGVGFILAPTGILGGAGVGLLWAVAKFGWRRAHARVKKGEHDEHADPRKDEEADAKEERVAIRAPRADPW